MSTKLSGIIVPNVTPTDSAGRVDADGLKKLIEYLLAAGVHGLFVGGSAGEGPLLVEREFRRLMEITIETVGSRVPLLAGVQDTSTPRVLEKIKVVAKLGYKHCVVTPPFYIPCKTAAEQLRHFGACVEATKIEIIPYNIPQLTQSTIAVDTVCEMVRRDWIQHIKDSEGNLENIKAMVKGAGSSLGILCGNDQISGEALLAGATGLVSGTANMIPEQFVNLYNTAKAGDRTRVGKQQNEINDFVNKIVLSGPAWLPALKYFSAKRCGGDFEMAIPPVAEMSERQRTEADKYLSDKLQLVVTSAS
jgi:4-hydroxy-tetrahydrodipicolinate synthase